MFFKYFCCVTLMLMYVTSSLGYQSYSNLDHEEEEPEIVLLPNSPSLNYETINEPDIVYGVVHNAPGHNHFNHHNYDHLHNHNEKTSEERNKQFIYKIQTDENGNQISVLSPANPRNRKRLATPPLEVIPMEDKPIKFHKIKPAMSVKEENTRTYRAAKMSSNSYGCPDGYRPDRRGICRLVW